MCEHLFPPSPNWYLSKNFSMREDGSVAYGSMDGIVILNLDNGKISPSLINGAHKQRVTSVTFSPNSGREKLQDLIVSSSEDGFVKIWKVSDLVQVSGHNSHNETAQKIEVKVLNADWSTYNSQFIVSVADNNSVVLWDVIANTTVSFTFNKLFPTVVACSLHSEKVVAVGTKKGKICILKLTKNGECLHTFEGHSREVQSLSWCPALFNVFKKENTKEYLLASACEEKALVWRTEQGTLEIAVGPPKFCLSKKEGRKFQSKGHNDVGFISLFWAEPFVIYASNKYGEVIQFDIKKFIEGLESQNLTEMQLNQRVMHSWKICHSYHSDYIFNLSGWISKDGLEVHEDESSKSLKVPSNLLWTFSRDKKIIGIDRFSENAERVYDLCTINAHPYQVRSSPHDPRLLALCVGDGFIRIWNSQKSSGDVIIHSVRNYGRTYSIAWHPIKEKLLAFGTNQGSVGFMNAFDHKGTTVLKPHSGVVYCLNWGPSIVKRGVVTKSDEFSLYSIGNGLLLEYDTIKKLSEVVNLEEINFPGQPVALEWKPDYTIVALSSSEGSIVLIEPSNFKVLHQVKCDNKEIFPIAWHPITTTFSTAKASMQGFFSHGCYSGEPILKVYNCALSDGKVNLEITRLKGHTNSVQSVCWSPHEEGRLVSSGKDFTIRIWDVIKETQLSCFVAHPSKVAYFCLWSPVNYDIVIFGCQDRIITSWEISNAIKGPVIKEASSKKSKDAKMVQATHNTRNLVGKDNVKSNKAEILLKVETEVSMLAKKADLIKNPKPNKLFRKAWESDGDLINSCYQILKGNEDCRSQLDYVLPFLNEESKLLSYLNSEEESHQKSNNWMDYYQISIYRGNLKEVIEDAIQNGHLNDFLVSLAPSISPRLWQEACISYSKTLAEKKEYRKAACYLLTVRKIYEAIDLLVSENLYLDAICIAQNRLPSSDPVLIDIIKKYANCLADTGCSLRACLCFLYLKDYSRVYQICSKKKDIEILNLGALAAKRMGDKNREIEIAEEILMTKMGRLEWDSADRIVRDFSDLKHLELMYNVLKAIYGVGSGKFILDTDLLSYLKKEKRFGVEITSLYKDFNCKYDEDTIFFKLEMLYTVVAFELSRALCSSNKDQHLMHIIRALNFASRFTRTSPGEKHPLYNLCNWLSPTQGFLSEGSIFRYVEGINRDRLISLRAYLCQGIIEELIRIFADGNKTEEISMLALSLETLLDDVFDEETIIYSRNKVKAKSCEKRVSELLHSMTLTDDTITESKNNQMSDSSVNTSSEKENSWESEMDKLTKLKNNIEEFENKRISAPTPAMIYCKLKSIAEFFPESENENSVTKVIEEKLRNFERISS